jgi:hypothetical protein
MEDKFNKLDNFLRRHLHDASENQNWNVPDDAIFEKAMRTVAEGNKKKRRGWILIPLLFAGALIVGEFIVHNREVKALQGKITNLENNLARESADPELTSATSPNLQDENLTQPSASPNLNQETTNPVSSGGHTPSTNQTPNANTAFSTHGAKPSGGSLSNSSSVDHGSAKHNPESSSTKNSNNSGQEKTAMGGTANTKALPAASATAHSERNNPTLGTASSPIPAGGSTNEELSNEQISENTLAAGWVTNPIGILSKSGVEKEETVVLIPLSDPTVSTPAKSNPLYVMQFGLLLGANQSWLTMKNIPPGGSANLYAYDNSQPGFSMNAFVNKPFSPKFSWQAGLGYHVYNNKSVLEDEFLLDMDNVTPMPNGELMYQSDYNLVNPIGEYSMLLEFRVSDQMHENDTVVEYTTIEQTFQSVMLDLGVQYDVLTLGDFKISLGTGLGLGYRAGLKNAFNVSTYHNDILQKNEMETPDYLNMVNRWHLQWLGNVNFTYYPTRRLGIILATQYNTGLTSIRDGGSANGPLTFLHAFSLSAGVTHSF